MASTSILVRVAGILMLGVFGINIYIGFYDSNLTQYNITHFYLNWLIAAVDIIAAGVLLSKPLSRAWVILGGILWPIVYVGSLAVDVQTHLCLGGGNCTLFPTRSIAFKYLILNDPSSGWLLWNHTMETAIALLFIVFVLSIVGLALLRRVPRPLPSQNVTPASRSPTSPPPPPPSTPSSPSPPGSPPPSSSSPPR